MQILPANLAAMFYAFNLQFNEGMKFADVWHDKIASETTSTAESLIYELADRIPKFRKWLPSQERVAQNASLRSYALVNDDYELTIEIDRNKIEDDLYGAYNLAIQQMGTQSKLWPGDMLATIMQGGAAATALCWDGQPFFSTSHPVNYDDASAGTYSNYYASGKALTAANYDAVRSAMRSIKGADGRPMGIGNKLLLVVPPQLESAAKQILNSEFIAPAAAVGMNAASAVQTNVLKGTAEILVVPQLSNEATAWYLLDTGMPIKPFVFQLRKPPAFQAFTDMNSPEVFKRRKYTYGADARGAAGYTLPFLAVRAIA